MTSLSSFIYRRGRVEFPRAALVHFVAGIVGRQDAEDVVQDVAIKLLSTRSVFRNEAAERTWIFAMAKHAALDHLRARGRDPLVQATDDLSLAPATVDPPLDTSAWLLRRALPKLHASDQKLLLTSMYYDTDREAAEALGLARNTYRDRLKAAQDRLRTLLQE